MQQQAGAHVCVFVPAKGVGWGGCFVCFELEGAFLFLQSPEGWEGGGLAAHPSSAADGPLATPSLAPAGCRSLCFPACEVLTIVRVLKQIKCSPWFRRYSVHAVCQLQGFQWLKLLCTLLCLLPLRASLHNPALLVLPQQTSSTHLSHASNLSKFYYPAVWWQKLAREQGKKGLTSWLFCYIPSLWPDFFYRLPWGLCCKQTWVGEDSLQPSRGVPCWWAGKSWPWGWWEEMDTTIIWRVGWVRYKGKGGGTGDSKCLDPSQ